MGFDYKPHIMKLKGKDYLPVAARIAWLRSEHPGAQIEAELVTLDLDAQLAVFKATVVIPETGARATDYGSETARDFGDYIEKASTKAIGRAIAALGYGTLMALELDEGERVVDSPSAPTARNGSGAPAQVAATPTATTARAAGKPVTAPVKTPPATPNAERQTPTADEWPRSAADWTRAQLRQRIQDGAGHKLEKGPDWKALAASHGQPDVASSAEMTQAWLLGLYQAMRAADYAEMIAMATTEEQVTELLSEALGERDRRQITAAAYSALCQGAAARKAELSAPLLSGPRAQVAS